MHCRGGGAAPHGQPSNLSDVAQRHTDAATELVHTLFRSVSRVDGFDYRLGSSVANARAAIAKCQRTSKRAVVVYVGTYLGAGCSTMGSKTDKTLAGIVGDVAHMFVDLLPLGVTKVEDFDAAGGRSIFSRGGWCSARFDRASGYNGRLSERVGCGGS